MRRPGIGGVEGGEFGGEMVGEAFDIEGGHEMRCQVKLGALVELQGV